MKKIVIIIFIIILGVLSLQIMQANTSTPETKTSVLSSDVSVPSPLSPTPITRTNALPKRLIIPSLSIDAVIESVGMDKKGNMDVPKDDDNVAWYNLGFKPGDSGSSVIAGHFDRSTGGPAVFYNLEKLSPNDRVQIEQSDGKIISYRVISSTTYPFDKLPMQQIFNTPGKATLNLITCEGVFDKSNKNYSKRLVVYTEEAE